MSDIERVACIISTMNDLIAQICKRKIGDNEVLDNEVLSDTFVQSAIAMFLVNIGEQAYRISKPFKEMYLQISWYYMAGVRHYFVHNYDNINWNLILELVRVDVPQTAYALQKLQTHLANDEASSKS